MKVTWQSEQGAPPGEEDLSTPGAEKVLVPSSHCSTLTQTDLTRPLQLFQFAFNVGYQLFEWRYPRTSLGPMPTKPLPLLCPEFRMPVGFDLAKQRS